MLDVVSVLPFLNKFAMRLVKNKDNAEDLVQDTVVKMLTYQHSFDGGNLQGWAGKIMFNCFADKNRKNRKFNSQLVSDDVLIYRGTEPTQETELELKLAFEKLDKLAPYKRDTLLAIAAGSKYEEAALQLNIPVGTVRSRVMRAREEMRL